jgi:hypothetical protein
LSISRKTMGLNPEAEVWLAQRAGQRGEAEAYLQQAAEWRQAGLALFNRHTENLRNPALRQSFLQSQQVQRVQAVLLG